MSRTAPPVRLGPHPLTLCVEGGGTHSRAALFRDAEEQPVATAEAGSCNPSTSLSAATAAVAAMWEKIAAASGTEPASVRAVLGCAGLVPPDVRARFLAAIPSFGEAFAISDGYASLVGAGSGAPCGMIVAGTGCAGHRLRADGLSLQRDGWGWIGGDRGSGFWIGLRAVRHALKVRDGVAESTLLDERINAQLGKEDYEAAATLTYPQPHEIAALARIVFACAEQGDATAENVLVAAAAHLRELFGSLGCLPEEPLFLSGSIAEALQGRIAAGMHKVPQVPQARALEGCRFVSCSAAPLEWPKG